MASIVSASERTSACSGSRAHRDRGIRLAHSVLIACAMLGSGCLSHPRVETVLYESPQGLVLLKEFPDPTFRASHPVTVAPDLMRRVLTGVQVQEQKTVIESTLTGDARAMPVFTLSEASFLAPLLSSALSQATATERVRFLLHSSVSGKRLDTEGTVFATEETLYLSLTAFEFTPQRPVTLSQPTRSFDRAKRWTLTFVPQAAVVNGDAEMHVPANGPEPPTLVISLDRLARRAEPSTRTGEETEEEVLRLRRTLQEQEERLERLERQLEKR